MTYSRLFLVWDLQNQQALISISDVVLGPQSVASDMRFELFTQNDVKQNSKRQRVINSRYREDYIEPIIYRAIMEWCLFLSPSAFHLISEKCSSRSLFLCLGSLFLATAHRNDKPPFSSSSSSVIFMNYGWDLKWLLCALKKILRPAFSHHTLDSSSISLCFSFSQEEAINELLNIEKVGLSNWGKMFCFSSTTTFSSCMGSYNGQFFYFSDILL